MNQTHFTKLYVQKVDASCLKVMIFLQEHKQGFIKYIYPIETRHGNENSEKFYTLFISFEIK